MVFGFPILHVWPHSVRIIFNMAFTVTCPFQTVQCVPNSGTLRTTTTTKSIEIHSWNPFSTLITSTHHLSRCWHFSLFLSISISFSHSTTQNVLFYNFMQIIICSRISKSNFGSNFWNSFTGPKRNCTNQKIQCIRKSYRKRTLMWMLIRHMKEILSLMNTI